MPNGSGGRVRCERSVPHPSDMAPRACLICYLGPCVYESKGECIILERRPTRARGFYFDGSAESIPNEFHEEAVFDPPSRCAMVTTIDGNAIYVKTGTWVLEDSRGYLYPCADDVFRDTYRRV